jgi:signal transduction histidine kinase
MHLAAHAGADQDVFTPTAWAEGDLTARAPLGREPLGSSPNAPCRASYVVVAPGSPLEPYRQGVLVAIPEGPVAEARKLLALSRDSSELPRDLAARLEELARNMPRLPDATCGTSASPDSNGDETTGTADLTAPPTLLDVLACVAEGAAAGMQFNELALDTLTRIVRGLKLDGGALYFSLDDAWLLAGHRGFDESFPMAAGYLPAPALAWTRSTATSVDFEPGAPLADLFAAGDLRSWLFLPVVEHEAVRGGMLLASRRPAAFDAEQVGLFERIRAQLIQSMRHAELRAQLEQKAHDLEAVIGHLSDALLVVTRDLRVLEANPAAVELLGAAVGPTGTASWHEVVPLVDVRAGAEAGDEHPVQRAFATESTQSATQWKLAHATRTTIVSVTAAPVLDLETGAVRSVVVVLRDQSEQHARDRKILAAEKYASISTLAAGVAHEFKNYLAGIVGNAGLIEQHARGNEAVARAVRRILDIGSRANQTALSLLSYVRDSGDEPRTVNLALLIGEILCLVEERVQSQHIRVASACAPDLFASVVPMKFRQVVLNVLANAIDAMPQGGDLKIELTAESEEAVVRVADTGVGIAAEDLPRVFDPFFSTKGVWGRQEGAGTGLGLTTSLNYMHEMGGTLEIESAQGQGTTVTIRLPALSAESASCEGEAPHGETTHRALLFETDPGFAAIVESALGHLGWQVERVADLKELCARSLADAPGAVVLDATMPGKMAFARAFDHVASTHPNCKIVVSTGNATDYQLDEFMTRASGRLVKSGAADRVADVLRNLLSPSPLRA